MLIHNEYQSMTMQKGQINISPFKQNNEFSIYLFGLKYGSYPRLCSLFCLTDMMDLYVYFIKYKREKDGVNLGQV
jgi:hypothetical protein